MIGLLLWGCGGADTAESVEADSGVDEDADGYPPEVDCNDTDASIHAGAEDPCDGVDADNDGTSEGTATACATARRCPTREGGVVALASEQGGSGAEAFWRVVTRRGRRRAARHKPDQDRVSPPSL